MAINLPLRSFYDSATEIVGVKSGLLLNRSQTSRILLEKYDEDYLKTDDLNTHVRIRADIFEDMLIKIRQKIGNLPTELPSEKAYDYLRNYTKKGENFFLTLSSIPALSSNYLIENPNLTVSELAILLTKNHGIDDKLCEAMAIIGIERNDQSLILPEPKNWDGGTELSKLYNCELHSENEFLEQKFIDYLAVNGNDIESIHWRNFERLCAQYFKRLGYQVVLGPGTNDGGVDIRVYKNKGNAPHLLVQCKRYKEKNKITIETVKSFYTDVLFENARHGLIATSSFIADGGKKVCQTRGYNIKFAEKENIKNWAKEMWQYK